jgi:hypothetical protein
MAVPLALKARRASKGFLLALQARSMSLIVALTVGVATEKLMEAISSRGPDDWLLGCFE